ncbi:MAG: RES domain-containing protein [Gemmatimonadetes bacterium]|nr:RES domain-containing protein [Gemmatimonadota bacterium]
MVAWRVTKARHPAFGSSGAALVGGRWHSAGRPVVYGADSFAGALLEILAHSFRPRTLPGSHHGVRIEIPDALIEWLDADDIPGWERKDSAEARAFGDDWLVTERSAVVVVPSLPARPIGRTVLINPRHRAARRIEVSAPFDVPWDDRLF